MAIRITTITEPSQTILKIDGRLEREDVDEFLRMVGRVEGPTALDLAELQSVDREAVVVLREILDLGVAVNAASPFIKLLLELGPDQQQQQDDDVV